MSLYNAGDPLLRNARREQDWGKWVTRVVTQNENLQTIR